MLPELFKSDDRVRILQYVPERNDVTVQSTAQGTGVSKPVVSRYLNVLIGMGLCERSGRRISWVHTPIGRAARRLMNIVLMDKHLTLPPWATGIGMYGSWAQGTNTTGSDLDLWILVEQYTVDLELQIALYRHDLSHELGYEIHLLLLTEEKLQDLRRKDLPFYEEFMKDQVGIRGAGIDNA